MMWPAEDGPSKDSVDGRYLVPGEPCVGQRHRMVWNPRALTRVSLALVVVTL
jgi:hypothetical protein